MVWKRKDKLRFVVGLGLLAEVVDKLHFEVILVIFSDFFLIWMVGKTMKQMAVHESQLESKSTLLVDVEPMSFP